MLKIRLRVWVRLYKRMKNKWKPTLVFTKMETNVCVCECVINNRGGVSTVAVLQTTTKAFWCQGALITI